MSEESRLQRARRGTDEARARLEPSKERAKGHFKRGVVKGADAVMRRRRR